ncbi:hypothetical protein DPMN_032023 [Dreissena polymorpha]|uniref:Uncharacterized protein n=1 Tax=Dreissena polymorpha TaxID=45954 RepID=A0A9D4M3W4_DREPO|nr:hypothetical protein DPMN_032023 [Dreissena polymorpha]
MGAVLRLLEAKYKTDSHETWHTCSFQCAEHVGCAAELPIDVNGVQTGVKVATYDVSGTSI